MLHGRCAIVTGAGSGIGKAASLALAREGARVAAVDISREAAAETEAAIKALGGHAITLGVDVTDSAQVSAMVHNTVDAFGRLDIAVNSAGVEGSPLRTADYPEEVFKRVLNVDLFAVYLCMKYEIPEMLKVGAGSIVNVSSILGLVAMTESAAYVAAKHGVVGLTKTAALEYGLENVRVNSVCPGFIQTPMLERSGITEGTEMYRTIAARHAAGRLGTADEVANAIVWLASDASSFVTGHALLVDGGYVAQ